MFVLTLQHTWNTTNIRSYDSQNSVLPLRFYRATLCISAVFAAARCLSVRLSVPPYVCHVGALYPDGWRYRRRPHHSSFLNLSTGTQFQGEPLQRGRKIQGSGEILRFLTEIAIYLGNSTRYARGCYETSIGSHMRSIEWWHFQDLEGPLTSFSRSRHFEVEYLKNLGKKLL